MDTMEVPKVTLSLLEGAYAEQVERLSVHQEQLPYVGRMDEILANVNAYVDPHLVIEQDRVVGFFLIDRHYYQYHTFASKNSVGVRAFFIDRQYQGKGLGLSAMLALPNYIRRNYPSINDVFLTVNCQNVNGYKCYIKANFDDTGELYQGGSAGPQHVMRLKLI